MKLLQLADAVRYAQMLTEELRSHFLLEDLFVRGSIQLVHVDLDRTVIGSAVPLINPLSLPCPSELRATSFTERRELGIFNIGSQGVVSVDGASYPLDKRDALYIGRGDHAILFSSADPSSPAEFYLLSYPAHAVHPIAAVRASELVPQTIGDPTSANRRSIHRLIHQEGAASCQLVIGFTTLHSGSVWNTMPPHTHMRRSEVYLYFDLPADQRVVHLMGPADQTRHLVVANKQVAISPPWSIHAGVGTASYSFCWGMGGENQVYTDMDPLRIADLL
ncbi:MAG TPA: 5-dehydro-4-deoxy-D-glucuronate isomerase [Terracidiphilus sp.]|jgi:4-deoxy-L-threo-5-hexosulose-uronate ketol-isomerase